MTFQITKFRENQSLKKQDINVLNQINRFVEKKNEKKTFSFSISPQKSPTFPRKDDIEEHIEKPKKKTSSQGSSPRDQPTFDVTEDLFIPLKDLARFEEQSKTATNRFSNFNIPKLRSRLKPSLIKPEEKAATKEHEDHAFHKLEFRSQFKQRTQIKKITNIIIQSHQENSHFLNTGLEEIKENPELATHNLKRKQKKSYSNIENLFLKDVPEKQEIKNIEPPPTFSLLIKPLDPPPIPLRGFSRQPLENLEKKSIPSHQQDSEEFMGSSTNLDQLFFHKTVNFGTKKIDEYYEILDEIPALKTVDSNYISLPKNGLKKSSIMTKYRTLNDDLENMAQTNDSIDTFMLKVDRFWLSFKKNQNEETIKEFHQDIAIDYALSSQTNLVLYSLFNLILSFFWIIINKYLTGFTGFLIVRIIVVFTALLASRFWKSPSLIEYHNIIIYTLYASIAIQIMVFTALNPYVEIVMELELIACYISITKFPMIGFVEAILISLLFLALHIVYLRLIYNPSYLMLQSTVVVILFNLSTVHLKFKTIIDNFNKCRTNFIKKRQLNNLIVNLLPNHVKRFSIFSDFFHIF